MFSVSVTLPKVVYVSESVCVCLNGSFNSNTHSLKVAFPASEDESYMIICAACVSDPLEANKYHRPHCSCELFLDLVCVCVCVSETTCRSACAHLFVFFFMQ